jgi:autotransporter-associated beta strand protein
MFVNNANATVLFDAANTQSGQLTINAGTVRLGGTGDTFGANTQAIRVGTGASLDLNNVSTTVGSVGEEGSSDGGTISLGSAVLTVGGSATTFQNSISGTGGITHSGSGTLNLYGSQSYSGTTSVSAGTIATGVAMSSAVYSITGTGTFSTSAANLISDTASMTLGGGTLSIGGAETFGNNGVSLTASTSSTVSVGSGFTASVSGTVTGSGNVSKTGTGQINLSGNNDYTGTTTVSAGFLEAQSANALGSVAAGTTVSSGATLKLWSATGFTSAAEALTINGSGVGSGGALLNEGGSNSYAGAITLGSASRINASTNTTLTLDVASGSAITGTQNLTFGGNGNILVNDNIAISSGTITKDGNGRVTISGTQTATGGITVSGGTLVYNASNSGSGAVTVNSGGTIAGTGSIGATTIKSGGTMSPGNSPGTQTYSNLTWEGGGNYNWQIHDATGAAGTGYDTFSTGSFSITANSGSKFNVNLWSLSGVGPDTNGAAINFDSANDGSWVLGTFSSISGFAANAFTINTASANGTSGFANSFTGGTFSISTNSTQLLLVYTAPVSNFTVTVNSGAVDQGAGSGITGGAAQFTGAGALIKLGLGTLVMTNNNNTYSGATTIAEGAISITAASPSGSAGALGNASTPVAVGTTTNAVAAGFDFGAAVENGRELTINAGNGAGGTRAITTSFGSGTATQSGGVTVGTNTAITVASGSTLLVSGALTGTSGLSVNGSGVTVLSGSSTSFSGPITNATGSTLRVGNNSGLGTGSLVLNGGTFASDSGTARTLANNITLGGNVTLGDATGTGDLTLNGTVGLGSSTRTLTVGNLTTLGGAVGGSGGLTKSGSGTLILAGVNTFSGNVDITEGRLNVTNSSAIGNSAAVTVSSGATLGVSSLEEIGSLAGAGDVSLGALLIAGGANTSTVYSGEMRNGAGFVKKGTGTLTLSGASIATGETYIVGGTLLFTANQGGSFTNIINIGETDSTGANSIFAIGGNGLTFANNVNVRAGDADTATIDAQNTTGTTTLNGLLTLGKNADIRAAAGGGLLINGNISGNFTIGKRGAGTATLAGTTAGGTKFDLWEGELQIASAGNLGDSATSINNKIYFDSGSLGATGTFTIGANNGMFVGGGGAKFRVSSANTLTVAGTIDNTATNVITKLGDGTLTLTSTSNSGNNRFDLLAGELQVSAVGNLGDKTGAFLGNKLFFNGGALGATGNIFLDGENGVTLGGNGTIRVATGNTLTLQGFINDQELTGLSLSKTGAGTLFFDKTGVNEFSGTTLVINEGVVSTWNPALLPSGIQLGSATAATSGTYRFAKTDGGVTANNNFTVNSGGGGIQVTDNTLTVGGTISGSGNFSKTGAGSLTLTGNNGYNGALTVSAGTLQLNRTGGASLGSVGSINVAGTATLLISATSQVNNDQVEVTLSGGTITRGTGVSEVFGNLNVSAASFLNFGSGTAGSIEFGTYTQDTGSALLTVQNFFQGNSLVFSQNLVDLGYISASSAGSFNNGYFAFADGFNTTWNGSDAFTITAIPEPSTYLAAAGLLAMFLWPVRRRLIKDTKSILGLRPNGRDRIESYRNA